MFRESLFTEALRRPLGKTIGILKDMAMQKILACMMDYRLIARAAQQLSQLSQILRALGRGLDKGHALFEFKRRDYLFHYFLRNPSRSDTPTGRSKSRFLPDKGQKTGNDQVYRNNIVK